MQKYKIIQFYSDIRPSRVIAVGLTRNQAEHICQLPLSKGVLTDGTEWFYGFQEEDWKQ
jgi:hypothetical protein